MVGVRCWGGGGHPGGRPRRRLAQPLGCPRSLPYSQYFGGVSALTPDQYMKINGFPNEYWGWGGEDDDIATR